MNESPQLARLMGTEGPTHGVDWVTQLVPVDADELRAHFTHVTVDPGEVVETEVQVRRGTAGQVWLSARMVNLLHDPDVEGVIIALHDISDHKRAESELSHQAFHDGLTGLPNRALYRGRVEHALRHKTRTGRRPAVLYLDLDGFKNVNEALVTR